MAQKNSKYRTTVRLPKAMQLEMQQSIINNGYGLRGKSLWVSEAILNLLELEDFPVLVDLADEMSMLDTSEVIYLSDQLKARLDDALVTVREHYPSLEGVRSSIIRTSIMQRLLRA